jgi:hypothetical protein
MPRQILGWMIAAMTPKTPPILAQIDKLKFRKHPYFARRDEHRSRLVSTGKVTVPQQWLVPGRDGDRFVQFRNCDIVKLSIDSSHFRE